MARIRTVANWVLGAALCGVQPAMASVLETVKSRGHLVCGVRDDVPGFAYLDTQGQHIGAEIDFCQAIAAAVLGDKGKTKYVVLSSQDRLSAVKSGQVDVLIRTTSWIYSRDVDGIEFVGVTFYDGQGFMARRSLGLRSILSVAPKTKVCAGRDTTTIVNLRDYSEKHNLQIEPLTFPSVQEARQAFYAGTCDIFTSGQAQLAGFRVSEAADPNEFVILPDLISKEPMAPAVRHGDQQWSDIVRWVLFATIEAEEKDLTSSNVLTKSDSSDPVVQYILGSRPGVGEHLGLDDRWVFRIVEQIGNYGEIFERHLGTGGALGMKRGINDLWSRGGLLYSPPLR